MSDAERLSRAQLQDLDREELVDHVQSLQQHVTVTEDYVDELGERLDDLEHVVDTQKDIIQQILGVDGDGWAHVGLLVEANGAEFVTEDALEDLAVQQQAQDGPVIQQYANIPEGERDVLSTSEEIAVVLHENWRDIAWKLGDADNRRFGVDTKSRANAKHNPSRLRHELRRELDRDFQATEMYRGLKRLAALSGGEEHVNAGDGRVHISGGLYEYRERASPDGKHVNRVLWRATE